MDLLRFLKDNVVPATGCTEPVAVAYAVSLAYHALFQEIITTNENNTFIFNNEVPEIEIENIQLIEIVVDQNIYKNAYSAIIPGTGGLKGLKVAAVLALFCNPKDKLNLFKNAILPDSDKIQKILGSDIIKFSYIEDIEQQPLLNIEIVLKYKYDEKIRISQVSILETHDKVVNINVNGRDLFKSHQTQVETQNRELKLNLEDILELIESANTEVLDAVDVGISMNKKVAEEGLQRQYGLNFAKNLQQMFQEEGCSESILSEIRIKVASAGDARMGGVNLPVMTTSGSGNMGITAILPVVIMGSRKNIEKRRIQRAVLLSHLITYLANKNYGHLSVLCGSAIKAGFGVAAAITYLLNGTKSQINTAVNLMAANNAGFLCDGAKPSCALKISTSAGIATECALLAMNNQTIPSDNGIIFEDINDTIKGIGTICRAIHPINQKILALIEKSSKEYS